VDWLLWAVEGPAAGPAEVNASIIWTWVSIVCGEERWYLTRLYIIIVVLVVVLVVVTVLLLLIIPNLILTLGTAVLITTVVCGVCVLHNNVR
jgi:hypothetical protein